MKSVVLAAPGTILLPLLLAATAAATEPVDYLRDVKPLLAKHCVACHGEKKPRAGLRLDTGLAAIKGGEAGPSIVPGKPEESTLIEAVVGGGDIERMPLKRPPLSEDEIRILRAWVEQGATAPADEKPSPGPVTHWAFVAPRRPEIPKVADPAWSIHPIDAFIRARLEKEGINPSPEADRATLLRRVCLDLTGLPPTPEEQAAFLADTSGDAYEKLVDRLLASPHYGERWARPWLDIARYADSNGYSIDAPRTIWKYRDWVIDALNRNLPFSDFVIDQIAGDLRPNATPEQIVATGFHRNTQINQEGGIDVEQFRVESIVDRVNTTATAFLGLTLGCCQCHDHKYDPFSQREYYELFAFFNSVDEPEFEFATPEEKAERDAIRKEIVAFHKELKERHPEITEKRLAWEKELDANTKVIQPPEIKNAFDRTEDKRTENQRRGLVELFLADDPTYREEHLRIASLRAREPKFPTSMIVRERATPRPTTVMIQGDFTRKGDPVQPGVPSTLPAIQPADPAHPTRLDLGRWLVDPAHPLTARVTVNRIWQAYFGKGLVETENDFGTQGTPPSHPELLDWLATELVRQGWNLKAFHKCVVTSKTYKQSSHVRPDLDKVDPANRLVARQSRLRLDAEVIRDEALTVCGLLSPRVGGPSVYPPQPDGVMTLGQVKRTWVPSKGADRYRRGLYTFLWRATPYPGLTVFDAPNAIQACTRRNRSNTPLQALTLLNDQSFVECAEALATRLLAAPAMTDAERLDRAFRLCLSRSPSPHESQTLLALLSDERADTTGDAATADRAAWTTTARVIMNLDEFITRE